MEAATITKGAHKLFLETLVSTRNFDEAVRVSGVSKAVANSLIQKYSTIYKAMFERLGLSEDDVMLEFKQILLNPEVVEYDVLGKPTVTKDRKLQLQAMNTYFDIVGATQKSAGVNIQINNAVQDTAAEEKRIYDKLRQAPEFAQLQQAMLDAITKTNTEA